MKNMKNEINKQRTDQVKMNVEHTFKNRTDQTGRISVVVLKKY